MSVNPFTKNPIEPYVFKKKPIEEIRDLLSDIRNDMDDMKKDIKHIRDYIKKDMIKKQIEEEKIIKEENEYVKESKGWWFS
tara:strand:+ start:2208 stop:2450 length:243 start_codon:yes stop_codon:yes gene_type:complete